MALEFTPENVARMVKETVTGQISVRLMENYMANAEERGRIEVRKLGVIANKKIVEAIPTVISRDLSAALGNSDSVPFYTAYQDIPMPHLFVPADSPNYISNTAGVPFAIGIDGSKYGSPAITGFMPGFSVENAGNSISDSMSELNRTFQKGVTSITSTEIIKDLKVFTTDNVRIGMERVRKPELRQNIKPITSPVTKSAGPFYYKLQIPPEGEVQKVKDSFEKELMKMYSFMQNLIVISHMWAGLPYTVRPRLFTQSVELLSGVNFYNIVTAMLARVNVNISLKITTTAYPGPGGYLSVTYNADLDLSEIENIIESTAIAASNSLNLYKRDNITGLGGQKHFFGLLEEYIRYPNTGFRR